MFLKSLRTATGGSKPLTWRWIFSYCRGCKLVNSSNQNATFSCGGEKVAPESRPRQSLVRIWCRIAVYSPRLRQRADDSRHFDRWSPLQSSRRVNGCHMSGRTVLTEGKEEWRQRGELPINCGRRRADDFVEPVIGRWASDSSRVEHLSIRRICSVEA